MDGHGVQGRPYDRFSDPKRWRHLGHQDPSTGRPGMYSKSLRNWGDRVLSLILSLRCRKKGLSRRSRTGNSYVTRLRLLVSLTSVSLHSDLRRSGGTGPGGPEDGDPGKVFPPVSSGLHPLVPQLALRFWFLGSSP